MTYSPSFHQIFPGNEDRSTLKYNFFATPVTARYIRLVVVTYHNHASLRMDLIGACGEIETGMEIFLLLSS